MGSFLGIVPAKNEIRWVHIENDETRTQIRASKKILVPDFGDRGQELAWVYKYFVDIFSDIELDVTCVVRGSLPLKGTDAVLLRAQVEGIILAALSSFKLDVLSLKKSAIISAFSLKRGSEISNIPGLVEIRKANNLPKHLDEALGAALAATL